MTCVASPATWCGGWADVSGQRITAASEGAGTLLKTAFALLNRAARAHLQGSIERARACSPIDHYGRHTQVKQPTDGEAVPVALSVRERPHRAAAALSSETTSRDPSAGCEP